MESAVASHADGLVTRLGQLVIEEFRLLSGVRGKVDHLKDEVAIMNAVEEGAVDHFVREWMKQVRELAYDAEDCIDLFLLRIGYAPPRASAPKRTWRRLVTIGPRRRLAADIEKLLARALAISERRVRYDVDGQALPRSVWFVPASTFPSTALSKLVGIEDQVQHFSGLVKSEMLTCDNQPDVGLKVFCIVGFAGLGKTTLAMEVCRSLEEEFHCQANVSVSQAFDAGKDLSGLLKRMLHQLVRVRRDGERGLQEEQPLANVDGCTVDELEMKLRMHLQNKRYLIVIDDVWTISSWEAIVTRLPNNNCSSRIIVTTRMEHVAKACSAASPREDYIHRIKALGPEDAKELFVNRVFGPQENFPEHLAEIMDKILARCSGLPLAIISIASLLASYTSPVNIDMWTRVCNSTGSLMENNPTLEGMRQIISLSYNHLPPHLKACMMYLSIFPEDHEIAKDRLVKRWIVEGLVAETQGLTLVEVSEAYFDELLSRNMIMTASQSLDGKTERCRVHDMMLEVIVSKALQSNFVSLVGGQYRCTPSSNVRRLSIQSDDLGSGIDNADLRHVRSLTTFRPQGHRKLLDRLAEFTLLRVLDLQSCKALQNKHMKHVSRLFLLRFLCLNDTDITELPSQINKLQHLQTLWLYGTMLDMVPESLVDLEKLEGLGFSNREDWRKLLRLPRHISKMKAIEELTRFELRNDDAQLAKEIGDLLQLRVLGVVLNCFNADRELLTELAESIGRCSLYFLKAEDMRPDANNMNFLLDLPSPPKLLRYLCIGGTIDRIPGWVQSLTHLVHVEFWWINLTSDEIYGALYKLPSLTKISLDRMCCSEDALVARTDFRFPLLKVLSFVPDEGTPRVVRFEEGAMPKLETLVVYFHAEKRCLDGVEHLTSLKDVRVRGFRDNHEMGTAVSQLKEENARRDRSNQFKVIVEYE
uniref:AAA+ ATPase domain-containing protein n=1 Tax=Oryza punctata TaxID=4537 RepID=A0A0E0LI84_ORYPU